MCTSSVKDFSICARTVNSRRNAHAQKQFVIIMSHLLVTFCVFCHINGTPSRFDQLQQQVNNK